MAGYINIINPKALDHSTLVADPQAVRDAGNKVTHLLSMLAQGLSRVGFHRGNGTPFRITDSIAAFRCSSAISYRDQIRLKAYMSGISGDQL